MSIRISELCTLNLKIQEWMEGRLNTDLHANEKKAGWVHIPRLSFNNNGVTFEYVIIYPGGGHARHSTFESWTNVEKYLLENGHIK